MRREQDARGREILVAGYPRGPLPPVASWTPVQRVDGMHSLGVGGVHRLRAVQGQEGDAIVALHREVLVLGIWVRLLLAGHGCCCGPFACRNRYSAAASVLIPHWRTISSMVRAVSSWAMSTMSPA